VFIISRAIYRCFNFSASDDELIFYCLAALIMLRYTMNFLLRIAIDAAFIGYRVISIAGLSIIAHFTLTRLATIYNSLITFAPNAR